MGGHVFFVIIIIVVSSCGSMQPHKVPCV